MRKPTAARPAAAASGAVLALLAALTPGIAHPAGAPELEDGQLIRFEVVDAESGERLYSGEERIRVDDGTVSKETVYRARDRSEVKVERVRYDLETLAVEEFVSEHPVAGERLALARDGERLTIEYRPAAGDPVQRSDRLAWGAETRLGKTLHHIIVRNWEALAAGRSVSFDLLVPSRFESHRFRLVERPRSDAGHRVFRLEPASWLVRRFVAPMDFHYDRHRRAVKYIGPSTVGYYDDPDRRVEIRFSY